MTDSDHQPGKIRQKLATMRELAKKKFAEKFGGRKPNFRESLLILTCIGAILFFWLLSLINGFRSSFEETETLKATIAKNAAFLAGGPIVRSRLAEKADELTRGEEISGTELLSKIGELGVETGVTPESSRPTTRNEGPFDVITVRVTLKNAPLVNLIYFDEMISSDLPSIAVTDARFTPSSADGLFMNASYEITAFLLSDDTATTTNVK